jgi:hypothetical protein
MLKSHLRVLINRCEIEAGLPLNEYCADAQTPYKLIQPSKTADCRCFLNGIYNSIDFIRRFYQSEKWINELQGIQDM